MSAGEACELAQLARMVLGTRLTKGANVELNRLRIAENTEIGTLTVNR